MPKPHIDVNTNIKWILCWFSMFSVHFNLQLHRLLVPWLLSSTYSVRISALLEQHWAPASDSLKIYPYTECGLHTWAPACAVTMCCLLSFLWLPWLPRPLTFNPMLLCALFSTRPAGPRPPSQPVTAPNIPSSVYLLSSISVPSRHLRKRFHHLWPDPSFNDVRTLQGPPAPSTKLLAQFVFVSRCVSVRSTRYAYLCMPDPPPASFSCAPHLRRPWPAMGLFLTVWRVWFSQTMCQEKHMVLLRMRPPAAGPVRAVLKIIRN